MESSLNENTYLALKRDIMHIRLKPGDAISAAKVAEMYSVSRTPAREAIVKLEREGLLHIYPQSKTIVSKINLDRAMQEWFVRCALEAEMVPLFIQRCDISSIARLREVLAAQTAVARTDMEEYFRLDNTFHSIIYATTGELLAKEIIETNMTHYNRIRFLSDFSDVIHEKTLREHGQIIEAAEQRDQKRMQELIHSHIRRIQTDRNDVMKKYPDYFETPDTAVSV